MQLSKKFSLHSSKLSIIYVNKNVSSRAFLVLSQYFYCIIKVVEDLAYFPKLLSREIISALISSTWIICHFLLQERYRLNAYVMHKVHNRETRSKWVWHFRLDGAHRLALKRRRRKNFSYPTPSSVIIGLSASLSAAPAAVVFTRLLC